MEFEYDFERLRIDLLRFFEESMMFNQMATLNIVDVENALHIEVIVFQSVDHQAVCQRIHRFSAPAKHREKTSQRRRRAHVEVRHAVLHFV